VTEPDDDRLVDPVTEQVRAFARSLGVAVDRGRADGQRDGIDPLEAAWRSLRAAGVENPGFAFARWSATGGLSGPLLPILANCPDVRSLLERLQRFHPLFGTAEVVLDVDREPATLSLRRPDGSPSDTDTVEASFALLRRAVDQLTQGRGAPDRVRLRRRAPADSATYRELLGDVRFGSAHDRCEFDADTLRLPIVQADPTILSMLEPYAERLVSSRNEPWSATVVGVVARRLADRPTLIDVARELALSPRALQARLHDDGTSFSAIVDVAQRDRALALLRTGDLAITAIASAVGFDTPAGFSRAVRRWTGMSPTQVRREGH